MMQKNRYLNELDFERMKIILKTLDEESSVSIADKNGTIIYANKKFCEISKYSYDEILGNNHSILKSDFHPRSFYVDLWNTIVQGKAWHGKIKNRAKDGTFYWLRTSIHPIIGSNGKPEQYISIREDVTREVTLTERLRESMETVINSNKITNMYENSPDLFRTVTLNGIITRCNDSYAKALRYSKEEIIGHSVFEHTTEEGKKALLNSVEQWRKTGKVTNIELLMKRKDGSTFPALLSANNLYDENGNFIGSNTVIRDLSEMFEVKKELEYQKIKRLSVVGELSARIAHDMKNPLSVLKNTVEIMQMRNVNIDEKTKNDFERLKRAITRIQHQIDDVLDFVKPKSMNMNHHSLHKILESSLERILMPDGVKIILPENDVNIICDDEKLGIVFMNLMTNAIQVMNNRGTIIIRTKDKADEVQIEVEDDGPGIPDKLITKIFDPLFTTRQTGTGLGLTSCKSIVEMHEGSLTVRNDPTTFTVILPKRNTIAIQTPIANTEEKV